MTVAKHATVSLATTPSRVEEDPAVFDTTAPKEEPELACNDHVLAQMEEGAFSSTSHGVDDNESEHSQSMEVPRSSAPLTSDMNEPCVPTSRIDQCISSRPCILLGDRRSRKRRNLSVKFSGEGDAVVTEVRERPRTLPEEKFDLFYSAYDLQRFRREYKMILRARAAAAEMAERQQRLSVHSRLEALNSASPSFMSPLSSLMKLATDTVVMATDAVYSIGENVSSQIVSKTSSESSQTSSSTLTLVDTLYIF